MCAHNKTLTLISSVIELLKTQKCNRLNYTAGSEKVKTIESLIDVCTYMAKNPKTKYSFST